MRGFGGPGRGKHPNHDARRRRRRRRVAAAAAAALAAGGVVATHGGGSNPDQELLKLHNATRAHAGCGPLHLDARLDKAAEGKADDMARTRTMAHDFDRSGQFSSARIDRVGYSWSTIGENIAQGFSSPSSVMTAWIHSPEHYANITKCAYTEVGFGENGGYYAAEFARPR